MKHWKAVAVCLALLLGAVTANGASITSFTPGAGWQPWEAPDSDTTPYWDNASWDGPEYNVGNYIDATGGFSSEASAPDLNLSYWGLPGGAPDPNFFFTNPAGQSITITLFLEVAASSDVNSFGWYNADTGEMFELFSGPMDGPVTMSFTPSANWGLYLISADGEFEFFTQSSMNSADPGTQHFSVFQESSGVFWIGVEDDIGDLLELIGDYNDWLGRLQINEIPEPSSVTLIGIGGALLAAAIYRRRLGSRAL